MEDKFELKVKTDGLYVRDVKTGKMLHMNNKYEVKQLVTLLNDMYNIIKTRWGYKE